MMKKLTVLFILLVLASCNKKQGTPLPEKNDSIAVNKQQPEQPHKYVEPPPRIGEPVGRIGGKDIFYDEYGDDGYTSNFVLYIKGPAAKDTLLVLSDSGDINEENSLGGNYVSNAEVLTIKGKQFIYVSTQHTYGHSRSYLYSVNIARKKIYRVLEEPLSVSYKLPDSLFTGHVTSFTLEKNEDNTFYSGVNLHSPKMAAYTFSNEYKLVAKANGQYILRPYGDKLVDESGNIIKIK